jgi:hypothetical protein
VLRRCLPILEAGFDIERLASACAAHFPAEGRSPSDTRTTLDVLLYAAQELVWRQRYSRKPRLVGADVATYFLSTVRGAVEDTSKKPRWYFKSAGIDEDAEDRQIAAVLEETERRAKNRPKPLTIDERRERVAHLRSVLGAMQRPPWAPDPEPPKKGEHRDAHAEEE